MTITGSDPASHEEAASVVESRPVTPHKAP